MIKKTTEGIIDLQFQYLEIIRDSTEMDISQKVKTTNMMINGIHKMASLELANRKFKVQAPELSKDVKPLQLATDIEHSVDDEPLEKEKTTK